MLIVEIPSRPKLQIENALFDFNGTLAVDGRLLPGAAEGLKKLSESVAIYVLTADTFGLARQELAGLPLRIEIAHPGKQREQKLELLRRLGPETTMAIGNGANDEFMLREAALSFCLINAEGAAVSALLAAQVVLHSLTDFFELIFRPGRLVATLRT